MEEDSDPPKPLCTSTPISKKDFKKRQLNRVSFNILQEIHFF
jgi:hypothetical protein